MDYKNDPNYWWLRLQYAVRDERSDDAEAAREHLSRLGYELHFSAEKAEETTCFLEDAEPTKPLGAMRFAIASLKDARRLIEHLLNSTDHFLPSDELSNWQVFPQILADAGVLEKLSDGWKLTSPKAARTWLEATELPAAWRELGDGDE